MVRHKTVTIAKELADTVKTCLLYLAMSQRNQTYIIEINPFTKEKIYHTYRMTQPNRMVKCEFNPITYKETNKGADLKLTDFKKFKHHFRQSKATQNKGWYRNEWERIKYSYISQLTNPQYKHYHWHTGKKVPTVKHLAEEIETLLIYLALDKRHFVTLQKFDPATGQTNNVNCYMSPGGKIFGIKQLANNQEESLGRLDFTFSQLQDIIQYLKEEKPSDQHGGISRNKWAQIEIEVALYRMEEENQ